MEQVNAQDEVKMLGQQLDAAKEPAPKEVKEVKPKKNVSFLPESERAEMVKLLNEWGFDSKDLTDMELINKVRTYAAESHVRKVDNLTTDLKAYAEGSAIKDMKFISRLYHMNVPMLYLENRRRLLSDADANLTDAQIWERIRHSGINPIQDTAERLKRRYQLPALKSKNLKHHDV